MAGPKYLTENFDSQTEIACIPDIILVCEGKEFPAHKMILSATSNYFKTMLSPGGEKEKNSRFELPTVGAEEMEFILSFLYTGKLKNVCDEQLWEALLVASHFLQIKLLFEICWKKRFEKLTCLNFLELYNLAFQYNDEGMIMYVVSFLANNFEEIATYKEFMKLNEDQIHKICQHPGIVRSNKDVVVNRLFRWTNKDAKRERALIKFLSTLDRQCQATAFLSEKLRERAAVLKKENILNLLIEESAPRRQTIPSKNNPENVYKPTSLMVFGKLEGRQIFRLYHIKEDQWSLPKAIPFNLDRGMSTYGFGGNLYVFGGGHLTNVKQSEKIFKFSPSSCTIASSGGLVIPVLFAGAALLGDYIYIVNGINEKSQCISTVQRYSPVAHTCMMVAQTNTPHFVPHVFPFGKLLLVLGSYENQNTLERYDPERDAWTVITGVPMDTAWSCAAICKEKLFIVPNRAISAFQIYDFRSDTWEEKCFNESPSWIFSMVPAIVEEKCLFFVRDCEGVLYSFDPSSGQWIRKHKSKYEPWFHSQTCLI